MIVFFSKMEKFSRFQKILKQENFLSPDFVDLCFFEMRNMTGFEDSIIC
jgi:hypothetical protein